MDLDLHSASVRRATTARSLGLAVPMLFLTALAAGAAEPILIDDFNDGNDDGWDNLDTRFNSRPYGPAIFDASTGEYRMSSTGLIENYAGLPDARFSSVWEASEDPIYSNGLLRWKFRIDEYATSLDFFFRARGSGSTYSGYNFGAASFDVGHPGVFFFTKSLENQANQVEQIFRVSEPHRGEEWMIEAGAVGNQVSMKWWRVGAPEPSTPQFTFTDPDPPPAPGGFGVQLHIDQGGVNATGTTPPWRMGATIDDLYFTPLTPGDYNGNGFVEQGDLDLVLLNWGARLRPNDLAAAGWTVGFPYRVVDQEELDKVLINWGNAVPTLGASGVPEPSAVVLACLGVPALLLVRRRRRNYMFASASLICWIGLRMSVPGAVAAIEAGHIDDFEEGTTLGWQHGMQNPDAPRVVEDGGPAGTGDAYLELSSHGGAGAGGKLTMINRQSAWAGDYLDAGISAIEVDLNNLGTTPLTMRLMFERIGGSVFTDGFALPAHSGWQHAAFSLSEEDLISEGDVVGTLEDVTIIRMLHNPDAFDPGPAVAGILGVDNLEAIGRPVVSPHLGDYNGNGLVEQGDLDLVLLNWGSEVNTLPVKWVNQRPTEGIVDQGALDGVLLNWGNGTTLAASGVPEPGTLPLTSISVGIAWIATKCWRRFA